MSMHFRLKQCLPLLIAFTLALGLRMVILGSFPVHLHQDEIMNGYVGRFILQNGRDLHGNAWPLIYFDNFGDYPAVIPMYLSGIFTYIFGVNEFAVRFPIAAAGALAVIPVYFIVKLISKDNKTAVFAAFVLAIMPWHIVLSRATAEAIPGSTLYLFGLLFLLLARNKRNYKLLIPSAIFFFSTYAFYHLFRVVVPLTILPSVLLIKDRRLRIQITFMAVSFLILTAFIASTYWGTGRFKQTSIFTFNNQSNGRAFNAAFAAGQNKILLVRTFDNKLVIYAREFLRQYLSYFSPSFLLTDGGHPNRYLVPDQGLIYYSFALIPACLFLLVYMTPKILKNKHKLEKQDVIYFLFLLLLAPVAAALTLDEAPNVHRSALEGVMLVFPLAFAFHHLYRVKIWRIPLPWVLSVCLFVEGAYFLNQYFIQSPQADTIARYDERTDLAKWVLANQNKYDAIYITREVFIIYILFYGNNFDPGLAGKFTNSLYTPRIGNIRFIDTNCPSIQKETPVKGNIVVIDKAECVSNSAFGVIQSISRLNATEAYRILIPNK